MKLLFLEENQTRKPNLTKLKTYIALDKKTEIQSLLLPGVKNVLQFFSEVFRQCSAGHEHNGCLKPKEIKK